MPVLRVKGIHRFKDLLKITIGSEIVNEQNNGRWKVELETLDLHPSCSELQCLSLNVVGF